MREIKFRGKRSYDKKWLYGSIVKIEGNYHLLEKEDIEECGHHFRQVGDSPTWVNENTIGQFTGLTDKNGKEIYEGDIVRCWGGLGKDLSLRREYRIFMTVNYCNLWTSFIVEDNPMKMRFQLWKDFIAFEVIGNIHDNPELITEK